MRAYVRRPTKAKPVFRQVYRKPYKRQWIGTLTATPPAASSRRRQAQII